MAYIRKYKTASGTIGVQVCYKEHGRVVKTKHVGTAKTERGVLNLMHEAQGIIDAGKTPLFNLKRFDK